MTRAICLKCGSDRATFDQTCPSCGHRPEGEGKLVAWLISDRHLTSDQLDEVQRRIKAGEAIRPSRESLELARRALGSHFATDEGMTFRQRLALLSTSVVLTPLVGWVLALWWRRERPRAAMQALALSLPFSLLFGFGVLYLLFNSAG
ncbi:MAG: hypothetical protein AAGA48_07740 [Myxococcota bacterium]